ncbi:hypothetical protein Pint_34738 [Pistacia integerrima]|uniref:Uncharacterized protein n=1 Tax=Pistacia integerrima TaxID=434235 RepID=A0ACC0X683_9ROSI|nr:hypothetical protein Pint_34738 [Pistacia integerrima]
MLFSTTTTQMPSIKTIVSVAASAATAAMFVLTLARGWIEEDKLDQFNLPCYAPAVEEVKQMIRAEGSFSIRKFEIFTVDWAPSANIEDGKKVRFDNQESQASSQAT